MHLNEMKLRPSSSSSTATDKKKNKINYDTQKEYLVEKCRQYTQCNTNSKNLVKNFAICLTLIGTLT